MPTRAGEQVKLGADELSLVFGDVPPEYLSDLLRSRMHKATRIAKRKLEEKVKGRLGPGQGIGSTYNEEYAKQKSRLTGRSYSSSGPVDLYKTGQLINSLEGRGRASPAKGFMRIWLGFKRQKRRAAPRGRGDKPIPYSITNGELAAILNGDDGVDRHAKIGRDGPPFNATEEERDEIMLETMRTLLKTS